MNGPAAGASGGVGPERDARVLEQCAIADPAERHRLLGELAQAREMLTLHCADDPDTSVVSRVLHVEPTSGTLDLEFTTDDGRTIAFRRAGRATAVAMHRGVKVQFELDRFTIVGDGDHVRLRAPWPRTMARLQRREAFRVEPPARAAPRLWLGDGPHATEVRVIDVSATGLAFVLPADRTPPAIGDRFAPCRLELPATLPIRCSLRVQDVSSAAASGPSAARVGTAFEDLPPAAERAVQVYVNLAQTRGRRLRPRIG